MGTVLAMKKALLLIGLLAACSSNSQNSSIFSDFRAQVFGGGASATPQISPEVGARNQALPMLRSGQNGSKVTWKSDSGIAMTFDNGVLISTRGLADDIMGADIPGLYQALVRGSGTTTRRQSYMNDQDIVEVAEMTCTISTEGREEVALARGPETLTKVIEDCKGPRLVLKNTYWMRGADIAKSTQAISGTLGFLDAERF